MRRRSPPHPGRWAELRWSTHARHSVVPRRGVRLLALVACPGRTYGLLAMPGQLSSGEREFATLVAQLRALEDEIGAARHASQHARAGRGSDRHVPREAGPALRG